MVIIPEASTQQYGHSGNVQAKPKEMREVWKLQLGR
jgi:hypothetical protein